MVVELSHHAGWQKHEVLDAVSLADAAYKAVRRTHTFLTDDNHTVEVGERQTEWGGKTIHWNSVHVYRGEGAPEYSGPKSLETDYWFAVEYRAPKEQTP